MAARELLSVFGARTDEKSSPTPSPWREPTEDELITAEFRDPSLGGTQRQRHPSSKPAHWLTPTSRAVKAPRRLGVLVIAGAAAALFFVSLYIGHDHPHVQRVVERIREAPSRWRTPSRTGPPNGLDDPLNPVRDRSLETLLMWPRTENASGSASKKRRRRCTCACSRISPWRPVRRSTEAELTVADRTLVRPNFGHTEEVRSAP